MTPYLMTSASEAQSSRSGRDFNTPTSEITSAGGTITILATAETSDRTGVEMEAMTAASVAALTLYDMAKGIDRAMRISTVELVEKSGGKSGDFRR